jgi:hypothetical protein
MMSRVTGCATCRGTRTRSVGGVVDDEPAWGEVVDDERRDKPRGEPRDVPRHLLTQNVHSAPITQQAEKLASHAQREGDVPVNFS